MEPRIKAHVIHIGEFARRFRIIFPGLSPLIVKDKEMKLNWRQQLERKCLQTPQHLKLFLWCLGACAFISFCFVLFVTCHLLSCT